MSKRFYSGTKQTEPNMRAEFNAMMDGLWPEVPKAQTFVLRKMKRQTTDPIIPGEGFLLICDCISSLTYEPDIDHFCPICQGEGYIWEEIFIDGYKLVV